MRLDGFGLFVEDMAKKKQIGIYVIRGEKVNENTFFKFKWFE